ncbi:MAG: hypothetical protein CL583_04275 [Alteromonadaceae bacterium]|nr:hypothetical protein [Alteromonadaceae bacterium]
MRELTQQPGINLLRQAYRTLRRVKQWPATQRNPYNVLQTYGGYSAIGAALRILRTRLWPRGTVLFYPGTPSHYQIIYKLCTLYGYRMHSTPDRPYDLVFAHEGSTVFPQKLFDDFGSAKVINRNAKDISKKQVEQAFGEVFGYSIGIDPATHEGLALRKSNDNYTHDGEIVSCPCEPEEDSRITYQRYIDTATGDGFFAELRVSVYQDVIPVVCPKFRADSPERFKVVARSEVADPGDHLSTDEQDKILQLARKMGVDYGEMDVMRDNNDGRIYVVDVNRTPAGPVSGLTPKQTREALGRMRPAFERLVRSATK